MYLLSSIVISVFEDYRVIYTLQVPSLRNYVVRPRSASLPSAVVSVPMQ